jgi:NADPH:quinone reductase-like Zn-dependent oxidoreductase
MKAAVVYKAGQAPSYGEFAEPTPAPGKKIVRVSAAAISQLTKARASGTHYSASGALPLVPGIDGVGTDESGARVYFILPEMPYGAMAERTVVDARHCFAIPEALDDVTAAAMANPGMSSWAALNERAHLRAGETVLINGATGASGRLAIQIAKHLGAKTVIATGRQSKAFDDLRRLGADAVVPLTQEREALEKDFAQHLAQGVDVVLDYLWGASAETMIVAAAKRGREGVPIRYVQIGSIGGANVTLPGAALRSSALQLMGSGIGSVSFVKLLAAVKSVLEAAPAAGFEVATRAMPLAEVSQAWGVDDSAARIVLTP